MPPEASPALPEPSPLSVSAPTASTTAPAQAVHAQASHTRAGLLTRADPDPGAVDLTDGEAGELASDFTAAEASDLARSLKALADPIRLRLLSLIGSHPEGRVSVFELARAFHVTGPTLSHHLRVLREAGLVAADRRGTWVYYTLVQEGLTAISGVFGTTFPVADATAQPADLSS